MMRGRSFSGAVGGMAVLAILASAIPAHGAFTVVWHNGTPDSNPAGSGAVPVKLTLGEPDTSPVKVKIFGGTVAHTMVGLFGSPNRAEPLVDAVVNGTADSWDQYSMLMNGADFFGVGGDGLLAPVANPVEVDGTGGDALLDFTILSGDIELTGSRIARDGENAVLTMSFREPVGPGEAFALTFQVGDVGQPGAPGVGENFFVLSQVPVPEPTAAMVIALGAGALLRRKRSGRGQ